MFNSVLRYAVLEIILISIGLVAILLGSIISIWTKIDPQFQNFHKPALKENDNEMSSVPSTLLRTESGRCLPNSGTAAGSVIITSNRDEYSGQIRVSH